MGTIGLLVGDDDGSRVGTKLREGLELGVYDSQTELEVKEFSLYLQNNSPKGSTTTYQTWEHAGKWTQDRYFHHSCC